MAEHRDHAGKVIRTRPLFPYPQIAKYKGSGSTDDAENFASSTTAD
jgi:feruloyl esterase